MDFRLHFYCNTSSVSAVWWAIAWWDNLIQNLFPQIFHSSMLSYLRLIMCQFRVGQIHQTEAEFQLKPRQRCHQRSLRLQKNSHLVSYEVCNWISFIICTVFVTSPQMYFLEYFKCIFLASWRSTWEVPTSGRILKWEQIYAIIHTAGVISTTFRANIFSHSCDLRSEEASYVPQCVI